MLKLSISFKLSREQWFLKTFEKAHAWPVNALCTTVIRGRTEAFATLRNALWHLQINICCMDILLFLLQREIYLSDIRVRKMHKDRSYIFFPHIRVINTFFFLENYVSTCILSIQRLCDRQKERGKHCLHLKWLLVTPVLLEQMKIQLTLCQQGATNRATKSTSETLLYLKYGLELAATAS